MFEGMPIEIESCKPEASTPACILKEERRKVVPDAHVIRKDRGMLDAWPMLTLCVRNASAMIE
jgi:hypothetical protein